MKIRKQVLIGGERALFIPRAMAGAQPAEISSGIYGVRTRGRSNSVSFAATCLPESPPRRSIPPRRRRRPKTFTRAVRYASSAAVSLVAASLMLLFGGK